jgi:hypothetical protein
MAQIAQCLPRKYQAVNSKPSTHTHTLKSITWPSTLVEEEQTQLKESKGKEIINVGTETCKTVQKQQNQETKSLLFEKI